MKLDHRPQELSLDETLRSAANQTMELHNAFCQETIFAYSNSVRLRVSHVLPDALICIGLDEGSAEKIVHPFPMPDTPELSIDGEEKFFPECRKFSITKSFLSERIKAWLSNNAAELSSMDLPLPSPIELGRKMAQHFDEVPDLLKSDEKFLWICGIQAGCLIIEARLKNNSPVSLAEAYPYVLYSLELQSRLAASVNGSADLTASCFAGVPGVDEALKEPDPVA